MYLHGVAPRHHPLGRRLQRLAAPRLRVYDRASALTPAEE